MGLSLTVINLFQERAKELRDKLSAVQREKLSRKDKINYDILKNNLDTYIEGYPFIK